MDTKNLMEELGGRKAVIQITGLTRGRISQWVMGNEVPTPWLKFFQAKFPKVDWADYQPKSVLEKIAASSPTAHRKKLKRSSSITTP